MPYRFATQRQNYSDYSSGKVFYNLPGHPAFPVRLASEVFQRAQNYRQTGERMKPHTVLFDPCCGGAYHLAVLAFFHWNQIDEIIVSDIDPDALSVADRNLSLLTLDGMVKRIQEISQFKDTYKKESHNDALASASALKQIVMDNLARHSIHTEIFQADVIEPVEIAKHFRGKKADLIFTDLPYGIKSSWRSSSNLAEKEDEFIRKMLETVLPVLSMNSVVAAASLKEQKISHPAYIQVGKLKMGFRQVMFLKLR